MRVIACNAIGNKRFGSVNYFNLEQVQQANSTAQISKPCISFMKHIFFHSPYYFQYFRSDAFRNISASAAWSKYTRKLPGTCALFSCSSLTMPKGLKQRISFSTSTNANGKASIFDLRLNMFTASSSLSYRYAVSFFQNLMITQTKLVASFGG